MTSTTEPNPASTTIPTPISLTASNPSLPPPTTAALLAHLRATSSLGDLKNLLTDSLARTGWTDRVRALAFELLRNGTADTFPELFDEVTRRAKIPKTVVTNGTTNGNGAIPVSKEWSGGPDGLPDVRIPEVTVEAGVEFVKEKIKDAVEVVDEVDSD